ncbi:MAG: hypothetical protein GC181_09795 [Bacteroidetes bacterium]|nr:hypothetical protein [Bacteroidota bacterium]
MASPDLDSTVRLIQKCMRPDVAAFGDLVEIEVLPVKWRHTTYMGFTLSESDSDLVIFELTGQEFKISKSRLVSKKSIAYNDSVVHRVSEYSKFYSRLHSYWGCEEMPYILSLVWLEYHNHVNEAYEILNFNGKNRGERAWAQDRIKDDFAYLYFNEMLIAWTHDRNYEKALLYGSYLKDSVYSDFEYWDIAKLLNNQLRNNQDDFQKYSLPDSLQWAQKKSLLSREQQIKFLLDRLHILNCVQFFQPGGVNYSQVQTNVPVSRVLQDTSYNDFWEIFMPYQVINPYNELIEMDLELSEVKILLPHLLDSSFIPTFSYHRDFLSSRVLYRYDWVVENLVFNATNRRLLSNDYFWSFTYEEKKAELKKIEVWCGLNEKVPEEERLVKIIKETDNYAEFNLALRTAGNKRYTSIIPGLENRIVGEDNMLNETRKISVVQWIVNHDTGRYLETVHRIDDYLVAKIPHCKKYDKYVNDQMLLYSSLYLIKYDSSNDKSYEYLKLVLTDEESGQNRYIQAVPFLLSIKDDKAFYFAEELLTALSLEEKYISSELDVALQILLLNRSEKALRYLEMNLSDTSQANKKDWISDINKLDDSYCEYYFNLINSWRSEPILCCAPTDKKAFLKCCKKQQKWLKEQFELIKAGEHSEIEDHLLTMPVYYGFVDSGN